MPNDKKSAAALKREERIIKAKALRASRRAKTTSQAPTIPSVPIVPLFPQPVIRSRAEVQMKTQAQEAQQQAPLHTKTNDDTEVRQSQAERRRAHLTMIKSLSTASSIASSVGRPITSIVKTKCISKIVDVVRPLEQQPPADKAINVLYLCSKHSYDTKMDRNRFHSISAISRYVGMYGGKLFIYGIGWEGYDEKKTITENLQRQFPRTDIDVVIIYHPQSSPIGYIGMKDLRIYKCITYNEMFNTNNVKKEIEEFGLDFVICHHTNEMESFKTMYPKVKFYHIPHCGETTVFRKTNVPKVYDFTVVGNASEKVYPLRARFISNIIPMLEKKGYKCHVQRHPGYVLSDAASERVVQEYVDIINQSRITLTCSSKYHYLLSKFVEIPMCGSVIASDMPKDGQEALSDHMVTVNMDMTDQEIVKTLIDALPSVPQKTLKGYSYVMSNRTQDHYAAMFGDVLAKFMDSAKAQIIKKKDMIVEPVLDLTSLEVSRHSVWIPDRCIKVPYQRDGKITKNITPLQESYDLSSIAHEYTIFNELSKRNMAPPVGKIIFYQRVIHPDGYVDDKGAYGFEMANAEKIPHGAFTLGSLLEFPITMSQHTIGDLKKPGNIINGHMIDARESCYAMMQWADPKTLVRIEGVNWIDLSLEK